MARYRKRDAVERRISDGVEAGDRSFTVDLTAKRATGVEGYRVTLAFLEVDGDGGHFVDLEPAASREEANQRADDLARAPDRLRELLEAEMSGSGPGS